MQAADRVAPPCPRAHPPCPRSSHPQYTHRPPPACLPVAHCSALCTIPPDPGSAPAPPRARVRRSALSRTLGTNTAGSPPADSGGHQPNVGVQGTLGVRLRTGAKGAGAVCICVGNRNRVRARCKRRGRVGGPPLPPVGGVRGWPRVPHLHGAPLEGLAHKALELALVLGQRGRGLSAKGPTKKHQSRAAGSARRGPGRGRCGWAGD